MFTFRNKEYQYLIWDWRSTLWDPFNHQLYPWVKDFFEKNKDLKHILISFSIDYEKRYGQIMQEGLAKYFTYISISLKRKREQFEEVFDKGIAIPEKSLIIGDNTNDEIKVAKDLGIDSVTIGEFLKEISVAKK